MKQCAKCNEVKPLDMFCKNAKRKGGYHYYCKSCYSISNKKWKDENQEQALATSAAYRKANKEKCQALTKAWEKANPEKVKAWRDKYKVEKSAYLQDKCVKYRAMKKNRIPSWLTEDEKIRIRCYYQVAAMYNREGLDIYHVDHIVPLQGKTVSGLHVPWNLQVIPAKLNWQKSNRF